MLRRAHRCTQVHAGTVPLHLIASFGVGLCVFSGVRSVLPWRLGGWFCLVRRLVVLLCLVLLVASCLSGVLSFAFAMGCCVFLYVELR